MDRYDLEPRDGLHQDIARLQALLCGNHGSPPPRDGHDRPRDDPKNHAADMRAPARTASRQDRVNRVHEL